MSRHENGERSHVRKYTHPVDRTDDGIDLDKGLNLVEQAEKDPT